MQYINGKLITEHPDNPACVIHKIEQVLERSEKLEFTLSNQNNQLESLKLSVLILEKKLQEVEAEKLKPMQSSLNLLSAQLNKKFLTITMTTIVGFFILWLSLIIHNQQTKNNAVNHSSIIELVNPNLVNS